MNPVTILPYDELVVAMMKEQGITTEEQLLALPNKELFMDIIFFNRDFRLFTSISKN